MQTRTSMRLAVGRLAAMLCFATALVLGLAAEISKGNSFLDLVCWAIIAGAAGGIILAGSE